MSKKVTLAALIGGVVIILGLVWTVVILASNQPEAISNGNSSAPTEQVQRSLTGKTLAEDQQAVVDATIKLLESTEAPAEEADLIPLLQKLDTEGVKAIPQEFLERSRFVSIMDDDTLRLATYQSMLTFASLTKISSSDGKTIEPRAADVAKEVFVDQEAGTAFIPMNIFVASNDETSVFSMEFVYINDQWVLSPYSILDSVRLTISLQAQQKQLLEAQ